MSTLHGPLLGLISTSVHKKVRVKTLVVKSTGFLTENEEAV